MALLQWKDQYSVGIEAIDHEHRELIDLINRLYAELSTHSGKDASEAFFGDLYKGISAHFALEERFMREQKYHDLDAHKRDHEQLLDEIREMMDDFIEHQEISERRACCAPGIMVQPPFRDPRCPSSPGARGSSSLRSKLRGGGAKESPAKARRRCPLLSERFI